MTSSKLSDLLKKYLPYIALFLLVVCILGFNHVLELRAAEGRRAIVTFEMMQNNNWIVPYQYGYPYYNKPPFYNWVIGSSFILFGTINEFALRFPGVLSLLLTAFLIYSIGKNYLNNHVALLGTEILFPARGHLRYTLNPRNMIFVRFELEGNSYRVGNQNSAFLDPFDGKKDELEIRRSELRFRFIYERQLIGFFWLSAQAGYRVNYSYNIDEVPNGTDFYRGFFGDQPLAVQNTLGNPFYFNVSINLVSP
ncbi:glycosyltransferase family 39 protein [Salibacteraceae bacterium]|nr:glycosyltransferase family 39 protein [Salibacteraceae bacterium]MDB9709196.1 glycosyltransferase family 39 protein [Salibacteraceae bacterium]MDC1303872.1 glycosyltransferase family 39 protein [Salibacteraceae bacterium]